MILALSIVIFASHSGFCGLGKRHADWKLLRAVRCVSKAIGRAVGKALATDLVPGSTHERAALAGIPGDTRTGWVLAASLVAGLLAWGPRRPRRGLPVWRGTRGNVGFLAGALSEAGFRLTIGESRSRPESIDWYQTNVLFNCFDLLFGFRMMGFR